MTKRCAQRVEMKQTHKEVAGSRGGARQAVAADEDVTGRDGTLGSPWDSRKQLRLYCFSRRIMMLNVSGDKDLLRCLRNGMCMESIRRENLRSFAWVFHSLWLLFYVRLLKITIIWVNVPSSPFCCRVPLLDDSDLVCSITTVPWCFAPQDMRVHSWFVDLYECPSSRYSMAVIDLFHQTFALMFYSSRPSVLRCCACYYMTPSNFAVMFLLPSFVVWATVIVLLHQNFASTFLFPLVFVSIQCPHFCISLSRWSDDIE